ncbi:MBL fold metallo-hydrolase, partial [Escherichia coli]|nr:MBL fold metallo-hydrolase [Escherichia coli]
FEPLGATYVIPGHGHPTNMPMVRIGTYDYLAYLRGKIGEHLENGGSLDDAYYVDQSPYAHLDTFEELATKNAGVVFAEMEFE